MGDDGLHLLDGRGQRAPGRGASRIMTKWRGFKVRSGFKGGSPGFTVVFGSLGLSQVGWALLNCLLRTAVALVNNLLGAASL